MLVRSATTTEADLRATWDDLSDDLGVSGAPALRRDWHGQPPSRQGPSVDPGLTVHRRSANVPREHNSPPVAADRRGVELRFRHQRRSAPWTSHLASVVGHHLNCPSDELVPLILFYVGHRV